MLRHIESGISGRALGANFSLWVKNLATSFGVKGVVFTRRDGSVRVIADGEEEKLLRFTKSLERGTASSEIENFYVKWDENRLENFYVLDN